MIITGIRRGLDIGKIKISDIRVVFYKDELDIGDSRNLGIKMKGKVWIKFRF